MRWRPGHGIQRDLGVPCHVVARTPTSSQSTGTPPTRIDRVTLRGVPALDDREAADLDRAIGEHDESAARAEAAAWVPSEPVRSLMAERDGLQAQMDEINRLKKNGRKVPARVVSCEQTGQEVSGLPVWAVRAELSEGDLPSRTVNSASR